MASASTWLTTQTGQIIGGTLAIAIVGLLTIFQKAAWRYMRILAIITLICSVINIIVLAMTPQSVFANAFNQRFPGQYEAIIAQAQSKGWAPGVSFGATLLALTYVMSGYTGFSFPVYSSGEVKHAAKAGPLAVMGGLLIGAATFIPWMWGIYHAFGFDFYSAMSYLSSSGNPTPVPATVDYLTAIIPQNPVLLFLGSLAFIIGYSYALPTCVIPFIRNIFAWSFDRVVPEKLSFVSDRTHTPIYATALVIIGGELALILTVYIGLGVVIGNSLILNAIVYLLTSVAAIVFPFRSKQIFEQSPSFVKAKVGGVPVITLLGLYSTCVCVFLLYASLLNPYVGGAPQSYPFTVGLLVLGVGIYYLAKWYRGKQGVDLSLAFKGLPPE